MPKKPKTKPPAKAEQKPDVASVEPKCEIPDWVDYEPLADFRLIAWDSDEKSVEICLTSHEYANLKQYLAELRGYVVPEAAHA